MPTIRVRPRVLRQRLVLVGLGAIATAGVLAIPPAHAQPDTIGSYAFRNATAICDLLDHDPTRAGLLEVGAALMGHGLTPHDAAAVTVLAVYNVCPRHLGLINVAPSAPAPASDAFVA